MMVGCVEGILGLRPDLYGIRIAPAIPGEWKQLEVRKVFRGKVLNIRISNPEGKECGCSSLTVNGRQAEGNYIPEAMLSAENEIEIRM